MENRITVSNLAASLAQDTGKSKKLCEDFIREFFKMVSENLEKGEAIRIKGFGTFKVTEVEARTGVNVSTGERQDIPGYKKVVFTPSKEVASLINAPFESFESVEMEDGLPDDIFSENNIDKGIIEAGSEEEAYDDTITSEAYQDTEAEQKLSDETKVSDERLEIGSEEEGSDDVITYEAYSGAERMTPPPVILPVELPMEEKTLSELIVPPAVPNNVEELNKKEEINNMDERGNVDEPGVVRDHTTYRRRVRREREEQQRMDDYRENSRSRFGLGFFTGALTALIICIIIFMLGCFFDWWPVNFGSSKPKTEEVITETEEPQSYEDEDYSYSEPMTETTPSQQQEPSSSAAPATNDKGVYDTVTTTRYLTTIARDHYGNFNFWPYIYLENQSILGHPDRITPGTKVVVPPLSKYGVSPANNADVAKAKEEAKKIYAKFK